MCLTCGCGLPYESHGDPRNITVDTIKEATGTKDAAGETTQQALDNLNQYWPRVNPEDKGFSAQEDNMHRLMHTLGIGGHHEH